MKHFYVESLTDDALIKAIGSAQWRVCFYAPGVSQKVAEALIKKHIEFYQNHQKTKKGFHLFSKGREFDFRVGLDVTPNTIKMGYGHVRAIQLLWEYDVEQHKIGHARWFYHAPCLRLGLLIVDDVSIFYSPIACLMDSEASGGNNIPNGVRLPYELLLKEDYQQKLNSIVSHLVSIEEIKKLGGIETKTRVKMEEEIKQKDEEIAQLKDTIEEKKHRIEELEKQLSNNEKNKEKPPKLPIVQMKISLLHFALDRMTFKVPREISKQKIPNQSEGEIEIDLSLSKEEIEQLWERSEMSYAMILEEVNKLRRTYLFSFPFRSKKSFIFFECYREEFDKEVTRLNRILFDMKMSYDLGIREKIQEKIERLFYDNKANFDSNNLWRLEKYVRTFIGKFNPKIVCEVSEIPESTYLDDNFQKGLFEALYFQHFMNTCGENNPAKNKNKYDEKEDKGWMLLQRCDIEAYAPLEKEVTNLMYEELCCHKKTIRGGLYDKKRKQLASLKIKIIKELYEKITNEAAQKVPDKAVDCLIKE